MRRDLVPLLEISTFYDRALSRTSGDHLFGVFDIVCFNESSPAMNAVMTAPFEMVQITGRVDFPDDFVAIFRLMAATR